MRKNNKKWSGFTLELGNLIFFWFFSVIFFSFYRLIFIVLFYNDITSETDWNDFLKALFMGFRFDMTVVSYFIIISFLSLLILSSFNKAHIVKYIRKIFQFLFIIFSTLICVITYNYYKEYQNQFNHFLFVGLYDDRMAVFKTIISDFNPIMNLVAIIFIIIGSFYILRIYEKKTNIHLFLNYFRSKFSHFFIVFSSLILFAGSVRGSFTEYPVRRFYASVTSDNFLNKTIINPIRSLNYAISDYRELNYTYKKNPFGEIIKDSIASVETITSLIKKNTQMQQSIMINKPNHIFLIVMESYDSWSLMEKYAGLNVSSSLKEIENKGIRFTNFLPSSDATMNSFGSLITNIPYCGINISKIGSIKTYPSSIFEQFKKLGYKTNFFYGGYLSWQNIANFTRKQGADNIYGAGNSKFSTGIWGINDENLYKIVLDKINVSEKSLNVILTTSVKLNII